MEKDKKILYLITLSEKGGAQKYISDLSYHAPKGMECFLAAGGNGWLFENFKGKKFQTKFLVREIHPIKDIAAFFELFFLFKKIQPDVVHLNSSKAGAIGSLAAKAAGIKKVIYTAHGFVFLEPLSDLKKTFYKAVEKYSSFFKDIIITVSQKDKQEGIKNKISIPEKFVVVHTAVDVSKLIFLPKEEAKKQILSGIQPRQKIVGTIANFYPSKGLSHFILTAKSLAHSHPNVFFVIIGSNGDRESYKKLIKNKKISNVKIFETKKEASSYLKAFDIYVCSSVKEGFPYSLLEAMAAELPIISTTVGGIPEMLDQDSAILIPPHNSHELMEATIGLLNDPETAKKLGLHAKLKVEQNFQLEKMVKETFNLYY